jgi:ABC-2 type transport system ATP-binding protein
MDRSGADDTRFAAAAGLDVAALAAHLGLAAGSVHEGRPGDYVIDAHATPALVALLAEWLRDRGVLLRELRAGTQSLEDVFLRLTSEGRS